MVPCFLKTLSVCHTPKIATEGPSSWEHYWLCVRKEIRYKSTLPGHPLVEFQHSTIWGSKNTLGMEDSNTGWDGLSPVPWL